MTPSSRSISRSLLSLTRAPSGVGITLSAKTRNSFSTASLRLLTIASISLVWLLRMSDSLPESIRQPLFIIATRSHNASTSDKTCEEKKTVLPCSRRLAIKSRTSLLPNGSRPDIGSSRNKTSGSLTNACARPARCNIPFEYLRNCLSAASTRPTRSSKMSARFTASVLFMPKILAQYINNSRAVR